MNTHYTTSQRLHFELRVALTLQPDGLQPVWEADLVSTEPNGSQHFDSMPALIRYLAQLERNWPPGRGIR